MEIVGDMKAAKKFNNTPSLDLAAEAVYEAHPLHLTLSVQLANTAVTSPLAYNSTNMCLILLCSGERSLDGFRALLPPDALPRDHPLVDWRRCGGAAVNGTL